MLRRYGRREIMAPPGSRRLTMTNSPRDRMLVDAAWVQARLSHPDVRVVDCDVPDCYRRAHMAGSVVPAEHYYKNPDTNRVFVMTPAQFAANMRELGIGGDTEVVGYDCSGGLYGARLWWALNYYGHAN